MKLTPEFLIRVNYTSGIQEEFWVSHFSIKGGSYSWTTVALGGPKPIQMNVDAIESVWQLKSRFRFRLRSNKDE